MRNRVLERAVSRAKRLLPTGALIDNSLNYVQAWNQLEYRPNLAEPRSLNELILASKRRFVGDVNLARRVTDKVDFKEWLRETQAWADLVIPTVGVYGSVDEVRDLVFARDTILKPTHLSGRAILFEEDRALDAGELARDRAVAAEGLLSEDSGAELQGLAEAAHMRAVAARRSRQCPHGL